MADLNTVLSSLDEGLSVQVSARAPWGELSFLVVRARKESHPRFRPWQRWAILGAIVLAAIASGARTPIGASRGTGSRGGRNTLGSRGSLHNR